MLRRVWLTAAALALFFSLPANAQQNFSCSYGSRGACLGFGDTICSSTGMCVDSDALCFNRYQCDYEGFTCKSNVSDCVRDYNALLDGKNDLARDYDTLLQERNQLARDDNDLLDARDELAQEYNDVLADYRELAIRFDDLSADFLDVLEQRDLLIDQLSDVEDELDSRIQRGLRRPKSN